MEHLIVLLTPGAVTKKIKQKKNKTKIKQNITNLVGRQENIILQKLTVNYLGWYKDSTNQLHKSDL